MPPPDQPPHQDLTRITLGVLFIGGLIAASFWVMRPFLPAIVWAVTLVIATWPLMLRVQHHTGNRRGPAVLVMTLALLLVLIVPLWLAISTIVANVDRIAELARTVLSLRVPPPPDWLAAVPLVGTRATEAWEQLTSTGVREWAPKLTPYAGVLTEWLVSAAGSLGSAFVQFLLTVAVAAVLYSGGERAADTAIRFGRRLGGDRGETAVRLAGQALRGVALGVVVTAVAQSVLGGIGLAIVGVPYATVLTALMFVLCLAQLGPGLVLIPAVVWMYYSGDALWATVLLAFTTIALTMDNFLRPILIRKGADLPLLLILAGVIGGLIAFGLLGIFVGPTVLATGYTLMNAWLAEGDVAAE
ncbi:MAG TPA: AI-2E family transporter YdiK [Acetobacteraceae bacterium]|nr:AI-2E family transporter YdiK [Acetobacteraceae bacterium]